MAIKPSRRGEFALTTLAWLRTRCPSPPSAKEAPSMDTNAIQGREKLREFLLQHGARYEVSPYYVLLDVRTFGVPPVQRKVQAGFDLDLYATGAGHGSLSFDDSELEQILQELEEACREAVPP